MTLHLNAWNRVSQWALQFEDYLASKWPEGHAVLAGGALRDVYFGKEIKDVDIFVHSSHMPTISIAEMAEIEARRDKYDALPVAWIGKDKFLSKDIEIIYVDHELFDEDDTEEFPHYILDRFDIGLCKIGYTPKAGVILHPQFILDREAKRITIRHETIGCYEHAERVKKKYPDFKIVEDF